MISDITGLTKKAKELKSKGLTTGEISDELNVSRDTALWLLTHKIDEKREPSLADIYVNWRSIGTSPIRLKHISMALTDLIMETIEVQGLEFPDVIVGIANSGIPLATFVALELEVENAVIVPKKHLWEPEGSGEESAYLLGNFAEVRDKNSLLIDDIITSGSTIKDTIQVLTRQGSNPMMAAVLLDKAGLSELEGIPVKSLFSTTVV